MILAFDIKRSNLTLGILEAKVDTAPSFEQTTIGQTQIQDTKFHCNRPTSSGKKTFEGFYHLWAW